MADPQEYRIALLVLSDKAASGARQDECLPAMRAALPRGCTVVKETVLADDPQALQAMLQELADVDKVDGVFTSGGTGMSPRDTTPQATLAIADYEVPGLGEAMRARTAQAVPQAILSRAVAVVRNRTLIVNLPGSPKAVRETLGVIAPVLGHAFDVLRGHVGEHAASS
jgi:molybdenum cofactor synthesis domain-containing protein